MTWLIYLVFFVFVLAILAGIYIERVILHRKLSHSSQSYFGPAKNQKDRLDNFELYRDECIRTGSPLVCDGVL